MLCQCDEGEAANFTSLMFLLQRHVEEGYVLHKMTRPMAPSNTSAAPLPPQTEKTAATRPMPLTDVSNVAGTSQNQQQACTSEPSRRIGGVAPPSPYAPFCNARGNRRPGSSGSAQARRPDSASQAGTAAQPVQQPASSEFVDRWLEKLYFRNPVVVRKRSAGAQRTVSANPSSGQQQQQVEPDGESELLVTSAVAIPYAAPDSQVIAQLPPKPVFHRQGSRAEQIRQEVVQERLVNAFDGNLAGGAHYEPITTGDGGAAPGGKILSRPPSPMNSLAHGYSLSSTSKFVEKKKLAAQVGV